MLNKLIALKMNELLQKCYCPERGNKKGLDLYQELRPLINKEIKDDKFSAEEIKLKIPEVKASGYDVKALNSTLTSFPFDLVSKQPPSFVRWLFGPYSSEGNEALSVTKRLNKSL
jgi:hypothetical protein